MDKKQALIGTALTALVFAAAACHNGKGAKGGMGGGKMGAMAGKGECSGVNSCKGQGECGGAGHGCAGKNSCKGQGWISKTAAECKAAGGSFKGR